MQLRGGFMFCPHCGKEITDDQAFCQHCGVGLRKSGSESAPVESGRIKTPWENREESGFFNGLLLTLSRVLFTPSNFFRKMPVTGGLSSPLQYALIVGIVGMMFFYFWQILLKGAMQHFIHSDMIKAAGSQMFQGTSMAVLAFLTPFFIIIGIFITSGLLHVFLMMFKGSRAGYEATFRVVAYCYSTNIIFIVPICGSFIACVWALVITIIGLREAHEISGGKAACAVFFPVFLCCGIIIFAASALFMGVLAASFGTMMQMYK
jgi:hypothetical protein